ncbi:MAG TPA: hypothetical protein VG367_08225 [Mucilaginibacter sp.]|nr:hypothetical protein [Mucilaginibacter sp.]
MSGRVLYPVVIVLLLVAASCHKTQGIIIPGSGKWLETKVTLYQTNGTGAKQYETTFTQPFSASDYTEFSDSSTFNIGVGHYYYMNTPGSPVNSTQQITPVVGVWKYNSLGNNKYVLNNTSFNLNPGGFEVADTVTIMNEHVLWLHVIGYNFEGPNRNVTDAYYSR